MMNRHGGGLRIAAAVLGIGVGAVRAEVPPVVYETAIPGYTIPHARDVVVDGAGNATMIGSAYEDGHSLDVLVVKLAPTGEVLWTRYVVSSTHNYATGLALAPDGNVWVSGWTDSPDFPLVDPMDATFQAREAFLMKLDGDDGSILYSTFLGGDYTDEVQGIALNAAGEIWLVGTTGSTDFPVSADAYQPEPNFPLYFFTDVFLTKLSAAGDEILYSTYFGGLEDDKAQRIAVDGAGNVVFSGNTTSDDFPLVNALQSAPNELFLSRLSADGSTLLSSTYFGAEDFDRIGGMALDASDDVVLVGSTRSVGFPTTPGAYQEDFVGAINGCEVPFGSRYNCEDIFVTKLDLDGSGIVWSTFLAGTSVEEARGVAVDGLGRVYVTGYTTSEDFPPDGAGFGAEIVVCRLDATGSVLESTYMVDSGSANRGNGIALGTGGDVFFTGTVGVPASVYVSRLGGTAPNPTGVEIGPVGDVAVSLSPPRPNPFRPATRFDYVVPGGRPVTLRVYDVAGHLVRELVDATLPGGAYSAVWAGTDDRGAPVSSGVYFARLQVGREARTSKVVKLRD